MKYMVNVDNPPPFEGVAYWERSRDPQHPQAFSGVLSKLKRLITFGLIACLKSRREGWIGIDGHENIVAWVADGTCVDGSPPDHLCVLGSNGLLSVPIPLDLDLLSRHIRKEQELY